MDDNTKEAGLFCVDNDWSVRKVERTEVEDEQPKRRERAAMYEFYKDYFDKIITFNREDR